MTRELLAVRRAERPFREPSAWLLYGGPTAWLAEIARWRLPDAKQESVRLYLLPSTGSDASEGAWARSALVAVPDDTPLAARPSGAAFARLGARLYLPVDARLEPELSPPDLEIRLRHDITVWHPTEGFVGFDHEQAMRPSDLIQFPRLSSGQWRAAVPSIPWNDRIVSVSLTAPVSFEEFFEEEQHEIGSSPIDEIPSGPDEPSDGVLADLKRKVIEPIARGARAVTRRVPEGGATSGWAERLEEWANQKLRRVSDELERLRNKELHRLLDLLETDSEKGLRHALPLGGGTHRGLAPPRAHLSPRRVDFQLGALGGGQPLDPWDVPYELQQKLLIKYRELANRERRLGRYRRAAYIYAELIGDYETAASVLKEGKHYREAAELYRKYLHRPLLAARTYESGGLFREAVEIYEELELWEEAGDVYLEIHRPAEAREAFVRARDRLLAARDRLGAARIEETKLEDVDGALAILADGWPDSLQATDCLKRQLDIQARQGFHDRTEELLKRLASETTPPHLVTHLVANLASTASSYPNQRLRDLAAGLARRKISGRLRKATRDETSRLLESLYRLAPEDRLLVRDGGRYLSTKERRRREPQSPRRSDATAAPELVRLFELPASVHWLDIRSSGSLFFALGFTDEDLRLYRGNWGGGFEHLAWPLGPPVGAVAPGEPPDVVIVLIELDATGHRNVILRSRAGLPLIPRVFPASRNVIEAETIAGDPEWLPRETVAIANLSQTWIALRRDLAELERFVLTTYDFEGSYLADVAAWTPSEESVHLCLAAQNQFVVIGHSRSVTAGELLVFKVGEPVLLAPLADPSEFPTSHKVVTPSAITGLKVAQPYTRSRVAASMVEGVMLHWLDGGDSYVVASDLEMPRVSMLRNGALLVVSGKTVRVYRTDPRKPVLTSSMELPSAGSVIDVVPGYAPNQFALLTSEGQVLVYALPSG